MSAPRRLLTHPALLGLACLLGLLLVSLPLGGEPWLRQPISLYPWLFGVWLLLVAFLRALGRELNRDGERGPGDPPDPPPAPGENV